MKHLKLIFILALLMPAFLFAQERVSSVEYMAQNPELFTAPGNGSPEIQEGNHQLMNGFTYTYVGYFDGLTGPYYWNNPPCYTGQEAAALLFGGSPGDYVISTNPNTTDPNTITFTAWMVTWGIAGWAEFPQDYKYDQDPPGYDNPGGSYTATSAYIWDNPPPPGSSINYVWRAEASAVPLSDWALYIGIGLILAFAVIRFRRFL